MGQYHKVYAHLPSGKVETIDHYRFGAGAKMLEQAYNGSPYIAAVGLLATVGHWRGAHLIVIGDYVEDSDSTGAFDFRLSYPFDTKYAAGDAAKDVTDNTIQLLSEASGYSFTNLTGWEQAYPPLDLDERKQRAFSAAGDFVLACPNRGEFIRPDIAGSPANDLEMPFVSAAWAFAYGMLACSDGKGGGDACLSPAGRWAGEAVVPVTDCEDMTDISMWMMNCRAFQEMNRF